MPSPKDIPLDYDRKHKVVTSLQFVTDNNFGFSLFGFRPMANLSLSGTFRLLSGRPFTWDPTGQGLQMNQRTPTEYHLDMRLDKTIHIKSTAATLYVEGFNLLNKPVFHYTRTFEDPQGETNTFKVRYMTQRDQLLTQTDFSPYVTRLDGYLYSNQPRHYRFGVQFDF